jgi:hypothetical protein
LPSQAKNTVSDFFIIIPSAGGRGILNKQIMVSISEKIAHTSLHQIKLYKQGLFWVAYEQSASYIWQLKGFKPTKKWLKNIKSEVVQVGFPGIEEFLLTDNLEIIEKQDTFISCTSTHGINKQCFEEWKANLLVMEPKPNIMIPLLKENKGIEARIVQFDISNTTPIEVLLFINDLKKIISNGNL